MTEHYRVSKCGNNSTFVRPLELLLALLVEHTIPRVQYMISPLLIARIIFFFFLSSNCRLSCCPIRDSGCRSDEVMGRLDFTCTWSRTCLLAIKAQHAHLVPLLCL